jgi:hypothetical protein
MRMFSAFTSSAAFAQAIASSSPLIAIVDKFLNPPTANRLRTQPRASLRHAQEKGGPTDHPRENPLTLGHLSRTAWCVATNEEKHSSCQNSQYR